MDMARIIDSYIGNLKLLINDYVTILDVGSGKGNVISQLKTLKNSIVATDIDPKVFKDNPNFNGIETRVMSYKELVNIGHKSFDVVMATDFIEHINKEEGYEFLKNAQRIAIHKVVIFTTLGYINYPNHENIYLEHKCGWIPDEFNNMGYEEIIFPFFHKGSGSPKGGALLVWKNL